MRAITIVTAVLIASTPAAFAQLRPPSDLRVEDVDNDAGDQLKLTWKLSPDDTGEAENNPVTKYRILRKSDPPEELSDKQKEKTPFDAEGFREVATVVGGKSEFTDEKLVATRAYVYRVAALDGNGAASAFVESSPLRPVVQWYNKTRTVFGILLLIICGAVVLFVSLAKAGREMKIRKIAGLEAVEEAVGRATEMGREVLFIPGIQDINEIQTVAGLTILNRVAELTAEYDADLNVPTSRSLVMAAARETVSGAYTTAGRPDLYNPDDIYYLTDEQFGFVAGVTGKMVRDKPAACFYMGAFYAESLVFAETAHTFGAIQIAGTAMPSQLPFFVAACDYVLIGEEFFAASAYLSGEPKQLGSLKGQDLGKLIGGGLILAGSLLMTLMSLAEHLGWDPSLVDSLKAGGDWIRDVLLKG